MKNGYYPVMMVTLILVQAWTTESMQSVGFRRCSKTFSSASSQWMSLVQQKTTSTSQPHISCPDHSRTHSTKSSVMNIGRVRTTVGWFSKHPLALSWLSSSSFSTTRRYLSPSTISMSRKENKHRHPSKDDKIHQHTKHSTSANNKRVPRVETQRSSAAGNDPFDVLLDDDNDDDDDMEARIMEARRDQALGKVSVPKDLDRFASELSPADMSKLGFRPESDPFGTDETPWKDQFRLVSNALTCPACGADFQSTNEHIPGYLPPNKYEIQIKLNKIEQIQQKGIKNQDDEDWSTEKEVEWLIQTAGGTKLDATSAITDTLPEEAQIMDVNELAEEMGLDLVQLSGKKAICKRCHGLQNFGQVEVNLRPGWSKEPLLSQQTFRDLLRPIRTKKAVIIALVDLFDFAGSVLPELDSIAGNNPVIIAANKVDLLPSQMGQVRAENWVRRELEYLNVGCLANIGGAVRLISCKTGVGIGALMEKARGLADEMDCDIYVVGAANAGKSTLLNRILSHGSSPNDSQGMVRKIRPGNINARKGTITTSPLPGTTLRFIKVDIGDGRFLYDTPGLLVSGALTQLLTPEELKIVVPKKQVEPVTFRLSSGKCILVGGLAIIELVGDCKPFFFTFFVANEIKLHQTDSSRADEVIRTHVGDMLTPPLAPGLERLEQLGKFRDHILDIDGRGWKEAAADIALTGLGWVAVTGAGMAHVRVRVPQAMSVLVRPPLMPFDIRESTARYTGSRAVRKISKAKGGRWGKGVGRR